MVMADPIVVCDRAIKRAVTGRVAPLHAALDVAATITVTAANTTTNSTHLWRVEDADVGHRLSRAAAGASFARAH
jgi:hypothetical protein